MEEQTIDLLTRNLYGRSIPNEEAIRELEARGVSKFVMWTVPIVLFPLVIFERLICEMGGDNYNEPTTYREILFSICFSISSILIPWIAIEILIFFLAV